jgi:hypothetical protein
MGIAVFLLLVFAVLILVNKDEINDELKRNEKHNKKHED